MDWEIAFIKSNGMPRKHFRSLKVPSKYPVKNGQILSLHIEFGSNNITGMFKISSGGELQLPKIISDKIEEFSKIFPHSSVRFSLANSNSSNFLQEIEAAEREFASLPLTEREAIIAARLGQGRFRTQLMRVWNNRCAVTSVGIPSLLRASHIKPWRLSNNSERLDPDNGLLLIANLDAAFDTKLITFDDSGLMLFSDELGPEPHLVLGVAVNSRLIRQPSPRQKAFLAQHRKAAGLF